MFDRKQQNSVKQLYFNLKINYLKKKKKETQKREGPKRNFHGQRMKKGSRSVCFMYLPAALCGLGRMEPEGREGQSLGQTNLASILALSPKT